MVIPAKAGIHWAAARLAEMWVPAGVYPRAGAMYFRVTLLEPGLGTTIGADFDNRP